MIRVLVAYTTRNKNSGINKYLYNVVDIIKAKYNENIEFDFLASDYDDELKEYLKDKGNVYKIHSLKHPIKRYKDIDKIIKNNNYDVAYINISESFNICTALAAKKNKIKRVAIHSHSDGPSGRNIFIRKIRTFINFIFKKRLCSCGTIFFACSKQAGKWTFGKKIINSKKFHIINNTIDIKRYCYNDKAREKYRKIYKIKDNEVLLGNIGNFNAQKNQIFLLKLIKELKNTKKYKLMLVGDGPLKRKFEKYIKKNGLDAYVIFTGSINNVNEIVQAMDIFLFPSIFEGFGIAALEAQAAGLPTVISNKVPEEVVMSDDVIKLPLNKEKWIASILKLKKIDRLNKKLGKKIYQFDNSNINQYKYIIEKED